MIQPNDNSNRPYLDDGFERYIVCDTETTGFYPAAGDKMVEFCFYEIDRYGNHIDNLHSLINPERPIPQVVINIHGIDNQKVAGAPTWSQFHEKMTEFLKKGGLPKEKQCIIIHNAAFDVSFIETQMQQEGYDRFTLSDYATIIDSVHVAKKLFPSQKVNLDELCRKMQVDNSSRTLHGALLDCQLLADVYVRLCYSLDEKQRQRLAQVDQFRYDGPLPTAQVPVSDDELQRHREIYTGLQEFEAGRGEHQQNSYDEEENDDFLQAADDGYGMQPN